MSSFDLKQFDLKSQVSVDIFAQKESDKNDKLSVQLGKLHLGGEKLVDQVVLSQQSTQSNTPLRGQASLNFDERAGLPAHLQRYAATSSLKKTQSGQVQGIDDCIY